MNNVDLNALPLQYAKKPQLEAMLPATEQPIAAKPAPIPEAAPPPEILAETLLSYGHKATEENKAMLRFMLENGISATKENFQKMNQAMKLAKTPDKALFMLQNSLKLTESNAAVLDGLASGTTRITDQINNLLLAVEQLEDTALAAQLKEILAGKGKTSPTPTQGGTSGTPTATETQAQAQSAQNSQPATATPPTQTAQSASATQPAQPAQSPQAQQPPQVAQQPAQSTQQPPQSVQQPAQSTQQPPQLVQQPAQATQQPPQAAQQPAQATTPPPSSTAQAAQPAHTTQAPAPTTQTAPPTPPAPAPTLTSNFQPLSFSISDSTPADIDRFTQNLREILAQVQQALGNSEAPAESGTTRVMQEARTLESHLDFTSQLRNQLYVQLPMYHNGEHTNLHIFKDAKKTAGEGGEKSSSALIALDTTSLGHFETYVQKNAQAITLQFRLENDEIVQAVRENIHNLDALLKDHGFSLENFSFLPQDKPYTVLDAPKASEVAFGDEIPHFDAHV